MKGGYTGASGTVCLSNVRVHMFKSVKGHVSHTTYSDKERAGPKRWGLMYQNRNPPIKHVCRCDPSRDGEVQVKDEEDAVAAKKKEAMLERIQKAKAYKDKVSSSGNQGDENKKQETPYIFDAFAKYAEDSAKTESDEFLKAQEAVSGSESDAAASSKETNESEEKEENLVDNNTKVNKSGDSSKAATWLQSVSSLQEGNKVDPNLNAEQFTLEKERLIRSQKVTIERAKGNVAGTNRTMPVDDYGIAQQFDEAEQAMAAEREAARQKEEEEEDALHKPKVATWGVFPRPQNISEAYGGGRNIRPGQELESKEEAKKRGDRVSKALADYRKNAGLEVDAAIEEKATKLYEEGEYLFERGSIASALEKFSASADLVPLKCKIGGLANFRKAVCLDSLGRNEEAYPIYKSLKGHTAPGVSKNSQRMLFGFRAAKKLKVDTMDYSAGGVEAWRGYFDKATEGTWAAYRASQSDSEEDQATEKSATVVATAVMLLPLILVSVLASQH